MHPKGANSMAVSGLTFRKILVTLGGPFLSVYIYNCRHKWAEKIALSPHS